MIILMETYKLQLKFSQNYTENTVGKNNDLKTLNQYAPKCLEKVVLKLRKSKKL